MKWLPKTLFCQILLALFTGLLIAQLLGLWLILDDRSRLNYKLLAEYAAQRTAGIVTVLGDAESGERTGLVTALSVQPTTLSLTLPWYTGPIDQSEDARIIAQQISSKLVRPLPIQVLSMKRVDRNPFELHFHGNEERER